MTLRRFFVHRPRLVKPAGIVAFHEIDDADDFTALPEVPFWKQANDWLMSALRSLLPHPDVPGRLWTPSAAACRILLAFSRYSGLRST
jgi:hypothetical protein